MITMTLVIYSAAGVTMWLMFPELRRIPRDACVAGGVLILAFALTLLHVMGGWPFTINQLISDTFIDLYKLIESLSR